MPSDSSLKGEADIDWDDAEAREALLGQLVEDAGRALELARRARASCAPESQADGRLVQVCEVLGQVLCRDVERKPDGGVQIRKGTSAEQVCSVHDPEMRHGAQEHIDALRQPQAGDGDGGESQVITAIEMMEGSAKDDEGSLGLTLQSEANTGLAVEAALTSGSAPWQPASGNAVPSSRSSASNARWSSIGWHA